eukprot:9635069-Lingulodinium_polyedra.AAC.1
MRCAKGAEGVASLAGRWNLRVGRRPGPTQRARSSTSVGRRVKIMDPGAATSGSITMHRRME